MIVPRDYLVDAPSPLVSAQDRIRPPADPPHSIFDRPEAAKRGEGDCKSHGLVRTYPPPSHPHSL